MEQYHQFQMLKVDCIIILNVLPVEGAWHIVVVLQAGVGRVAPPPQVLLLEEPPLESILTAVVVVGDLVVRALRGRRRRQQPARSLFGRIFVIF